MYLTKSIESYRNDCLDRKRFLESELAAMPEGSLRIASCREYYTWRVWRPGKGSQYLPKSEKDLAACLAKKTLLECELHDVKIDLEACERFLRYEGSSINATDRLFMSASPEFRRLLGDTFQTEEEKVAAWENQPYEKSEKYAGELIVPTLKEGEMVRSKFEASAADCLYTLGIPYKYEKITKIGRIKVAIDFTALDVRTFEEIPIELFGMMDDENYIQQYRQKMSHYINAGYIPGVNMITLYESQNYRLSSKEINSAFKNFFFNHPPVKFDPLK